MFGFVGRKELSEDFLLSEITWSGGLRRNLYAVKPDAIIKVIITKYIVLNDLLSDNFKAFKNIKI